MAESRRKLDSKKYQKEEDEEEGSNSAFYWKWGIILGLGAIAIIVGMFYLSGFLSGK